MSFLTVIPQLLAAAAADLEDIGSALSAANVAASAQTTAVMAAAGDEVSVAIAALFSGHAQDYQALSAQAEEFHQQLVQTLKGAGGSYAATEAANASPLQNVRLQGVINAPTQTLSDHPLIGNSADRMLPWRAGGADGLPHGNFGTGGTGGLLFPTAGVGGQGGGGGAGETFARRGLEPPGLPLSGARETAGGGREATCGPQPQQGDRTGEYRSGHGSDGPLTIIRPDAPRLANGAERTVWQALTDQLEPSDLVIAGQRVTDHLKDHEIDFVVAIEGAGIVCLEVKGGEVWHDGTSWWQKRRNKDVRIEPVRQVREACYALRHFVERDPRWTRGRLRWDHIVVLPNTELPQEFALPECPRWKVIDRTQLPSLARRLRHVLVCQELDRPLVDKTGIDQLQTALDGRGLPQRKVPRILEDEDAVA
jgi:PE family/Nuclease-related domain